MKCEQCGKELDLETLQVRTQHVVEHGARSEAPEIEVGIQCKCGADYATYIGIKDLVLMS